MTATVNNQDSQTQVQSNPSSSGNGETGMQISAGPAALASMLIYEIMALYAEIMHLDQQQKVNMTKAQAKAAQGQAQATKDGGWAMMGMNLAMGLMSAATAGIGLVVQAKVLGSDEGQAASTQQTKAESELNETKNMQTALKVTKSPADIYGDEQFNGDPQKNEINLRMKELGEQNFKEVKIDPKTGEADEITQKALIRMQDKKADFETWKEQFNKGFDRNTQELNTAVNRNNTLMQKVTSYKGISDLLVGVGNNTAQAAGNQQKANADAQASLQSTAGQMAGSSSSDFGQALNKAFDAQNAAVQELNRLQESNNVR